MARKTKQAKTPSLHESLLTARAKLSEAFAAINAIKLQQQPSANWLKDDPDIEAGHATVAIATTAIGEAQTSMFLAGRLMREEQDRRWREAPAISAAELEKRIAEQQAVSQVCEAFCRHCGKGYMMMPNNGVAEDGTVIKTAGICRCGRPDFIFRASRARENQPVFVSRPPPATQPPPAPTTTQISMF